MRNAQVHPQQRALAGAAALAVLLAGCAQTQAHPVASRPAPAAQTACVDAGQIPAEPPMVGARFNGDARHDLQVLAPNAKALRDWGQTMHAMLEACAGATTHGSPSTQSPSPAGRG